MLTYLITGAAGFIGAKVCEKLLADGHAVVGVDDLTDYYDPKLKIYRINRIFNRLGGGNEEITYGVKTKSIENFHYVRANIENIEELEDIFKKFKFEAVVNLAARAGVRASVASPSRYVATNIVGQLNVLECQRKYGVLKHVLASTSSVYGEMNPPFTEDHLEGKPVSPYAVTKMTAEMLAYSYQKLHRVDATVLRYFTVYGPAGRPDMIPFRLAKWLIEGVDIQINGDGRQARDFTFVDDIVQGTVAALPLRGYRTINLGGGGEPVSLLLMISMLEQILGKRAVVKFGPAVNGDVQVTSANIEEAGRVLNWSPKITLREGLEKMAEWHISHENLVRALI